MHTCQTSYGLYGYCLLRHSTASICLHAACFRSRCRAAPAFGYLQDLRIRRCAVSPTPDSLGNRNLPSQPISRLVAAPLAFAFAIRPSLLDLLAVQMQCTGSTAFLSVLPHCGQVQLFMLLASPWLSSFRNDRREWHRIR